jgi:protein gp37
MGDNTGIEWTDATWNPIVGCSKALMPAADGKLALREGCRNCYAIRVSRRLGEKFKQAKYAGLTVLGGEHNRPEWTGEVRLIEDALDVPLRWRKPRHIFVNSESDLFHEKLTFAQIDAVMAIIAACPQHTFQVLTKRPARMLEYFRSFAPATLQPGRDGLAIDPAQFAPSGHDLSEGIQVRETPDERIAFPVDHGNDEDLRHSEEFGCFVANQISGANGDGSVGWPMKNLWLGVSIEDQASADYSIPLLLDTPAALRWISAEPLLAPVRLDQCAPYILDGNDSNPGVVNAFNSSCHHPLTVMVKPDAAGNESGIRGS